MADSAALLCFEGDKPDSVFSITHTGELKAMLGPGQVLVSEANVDLTSPVRTALFVVVGGAEFVVIGTETKLVVYNISESITLQFSHVMGDDQRIYKLIKSSETYIIIAL